MTKHERILKVLESGNRFTAGQLAGLTGSTKKSVQARICELRADGYAVYTNTRTSDGKTFYRLGTPSRAMVRAAYALAGSAAFSG